jgi:Kef-type K+ transport system membrane component KefB
MGDHATVGRTALRHCWLAVLFLSTCSSAGKVNSCGAQAFAIESDARSSTASGLLLSVGEEITQCGFAATDQRIAVCE